MVTELYDVKATAEIVSVVSDLATRRAKVLFCLHWHNSAGEEIFPSSFMELELD